jgi:hypothetical protein
LLSLGRLRVLTSARVDLFPTAITVSETVQPDLRPPPEPAGSGLPAAGAASSEFSADVPQSLVSIDRARAAALGLSLGRIHATIGAHIGSRHVKRAPAPSSGNWSGSR